MAPLSSLPFTEQALFWLCIGIVVAALATGIYRLFGPSDDDDSGFY